MSSKRKISDYFIEPQSKKNSSSRGVNPPAYETSSSDSEGKNFSSSSKGLNPPAYESSSSDSEEDEIDTDFEKFCASVSNAKPISFRKIPGPSDISQVISEGACQPKLKMFPCTTFGKVSRRFSAGWYDIYKWLEYSITQDSAYCFVCRFFHTKNDGKTVFVNLGYRNWKKANSAEGFKKHENSEVHKQAEISYTDFSSASPSIAVQIDQAHARTVNENRHYISVIIEALRFLSVQGLALRGNDESEESLNRGNFIELINLLAKNDPIVKNRIESGPRNSKYLHSSIQNELIFLMAKMVLRKITQEVNEAQVYALLADETKDITKKEQLSIVIRYVLKGEVKERFLGFIALEALDASSLLRSIKEILSQNSIDLEKCVAQTYDGANVMSGKVSGVQTRFREEVPQALYVHCLNHRLHLVMMDVCKCIKEVNSFCSTLENLYVFMSGSNIHQEFLTLQREMTGSSIELKRLCPTRWTSHLHACQAVKKTLSVIIVFLVRTTEKKSDASNIAAGLLYQIDFTFIYLLCFFTYLLEITKSVSDFLQQKNADMAHALILINSLNDQLLSMKDETFHSEIYKKASAICEENGVETKKRKRELPLKLKKFLLTEDVREQEEMTEQKFRTHLLLIIIDRILAELERRFPTNNVLKGICSFLPDSEHFLKYEVALPLCLFYKADATALKAEMELLPRTLKRYKEEGNFINSLSNFVDFLIKYKVAFSETYKLAVISLTIPVSSAACERTFSCLKRLKSLTRNRSLNPRLSNLALLTIEKEECLMLELPNIIQEFSMAHENRKIILQ